MHVILTLLMATGAWADQPKSGKAELTEVRLKSLAETLEQIKIGEGHYPLDREWLRVKDGWDRDLQYKSSGDHYELKSLGADGKEGGTGDKTDLAVTR